MDKKFLLIILFTSFAIILINIQSTFAVVSSCNAEIKLINQDPIPAIPDSYVNLVFEVSSLNNCNGFSIKLSPEYPFTLDPGYDPIQTIDTNPYAPGFKTTWTIPYKIRVAQDALEGDYNLKLLYHIGNSRDFDSSSVQKLFNITLTDALTNFDTVIQDTSGTQVSIGIVNTGKNTANSLIVGIPSQDNFRATGIAQQIVGNLAAGDYTIVSFSLTPARQRPDGNRTNYPGGNQSNQPPVNVNSQTLKIQLDYTDAIGKRRSVIKEVEYNPGVTSNSTGIRNFTGRNTTAQSSVPWWWYVIIVVLVLVILYILYKLLDKYIFKKGKDKNSSKTPDWVNAERQHNKK